MNFLAVLKLAILVSGVLALANSVFGFHYWRF
jgi:hypothetical protein